mgnify:CR=1 FL=1
MFLSVEHDASAITAIAKRITRFIVVCVLSIATTPMSNGLIQKESVESISLSEWRFWNTYGTNKQYPTLVLSIGYEHPRLNNTE